MWGIFSQGKGLLTSGPGNIPVEGLNQREPVPFYSSGGIREKRKHAQSGRADIPVFSCQFS
jgi:hypothetical protein